MAIIKIDIKNLINNFNKISKFKISSSSSSFDSSMIEIKTNLIEQKPQKLIAGETIFEKYRYFELKGKKKRTQKKFETSFITTTINEGNNVIKSTQDLIQTLFDPFDIIWSITAESLFPFKDISKKKICFCSRYFTKNNSKIISNFLIIMDPQEKEDDDCSYQLLIEFNSFINWFESSIIKLTR